MLQNFLADSIETMKVVNAYSRMYRPQHFKSFMMTFGFYLGPPWILRVFFSSKSIIFHILFFRIYCISRLSSEHTQLYYQLELMMQSLHLVTTGRSFLSLFRKYCKQLIEKLTYADNNKMELLTYIFYNKEIYAI